VLVEAIAEAAESPVFVYEDELEDGAAPGVEPFSRPGSVIVATGAYVLSV
jgi:hypothetical protein